MNMKVDNNITMKNLFILTGFFLLSISCAKDNNKSSNPAPVAATCVAGQVAHVSYGCIPQGNCPIGQGFHQNTCTPLNTAVFPNSGANYQYGANTCIAGQVYTYYGCAPVGQCGPNQGFYNNQCVPVVSVGGNGVPQGFYQHNGYAGYQGQGGMNYGGSSYPYGYYNPYYGYGYSGYPYYGGGIGGGVYMRFGY